MIYNYVDVSDCIYIDKAMTFKLRN